MGYYSDNNAQNFLAKLALVVINWKVFDEMANVVGIKAALIKHLPILCVRATYLISTAQGTGVEKCQENGLFKELNSHRKLLIKIITF